jgi:alpha-galactosidase
MRTLRYTIVTFFATAVLAYGELNFTYDSNTHRWDLSNGVIHAVFALDSDGTFQFKGLDSRVTGKSWLPAEGRPSSPIRVRFGSTTYDANTHFKLLKQYVEKPSPNLYRQVIVLQDATKSVSIRVEFSLYEGEPVLRHRVFVTNQLLRTVYARVADMMPYSFAADEASTLRLWRVTQWAVMPQPEDFQASQATLNHSGAAVSLLTGAHGTYCGWMALRDQDDRGLFAGWEFDGQAQATARHYASEGYLQLAANVSDLFHPVAPGETFQVPAAFLGVFQGDWDEAGFRTQAFVEHALATPRPVGFPYVGFDSYGYGEQIDEEILKRNADVAAAIGVELFIVDLGWARSIGDWRADPAKFPGSLRAVSDYVHSLGMKFALHFALAEAAAEAPVLQENPDWTSSETYNYFGALSLCLSNRPTRDWLIQQALAMIDDYNVDWILQDGEHMVKQCTKTTHTHDSRDSNYANSVEGLNYVVSEIRRQRPSVMWENCENGGNMMTFNMVQSYVTSITNDASGALGSRQAVYGATYPFSPRFAERYMPEQPSSTYLTRSYMFGGPWHLMSRLAELSSDDRALVTREISTYKQIRSRIEAGRVYHVTTTPGQGKFDALQSYNTTTDSAIAIVTRESAKAKSTVIKLSGFVATRSYLVRFQDDPRVLTMTGEQLNQDGVLVKLPEMQSAEIVYVDPLQ